jgi:hypothetical protein
LQPWKRFGNPRWLTSLWSKRKRNVRAELDETKLDRLHSTVSLPFEAGEHRKIARQDRGRPRTDG